LTRKQKENYELKFLSTKKKLSNSEINYQICWRVVTVIQVKFDQAKSDEKENENDFSNCSLP
jgi:hypothetical protein